MKQKKGERDGFFLNLRFIFLKVKALYEYQPSRSDELHIKADDVITVVKDEDADWWLGQLDDGRQGYFPSNYVGESLGSKGKILPHPAVFGDVVSSLQNREQIYKLCKCLKLQVTFTTLLLTTLLL